MPPRPEPGAGVTGYLPFPGDTLRLTRTAVRTVGLWLLTFALVLLTMEWIARRELARRLLLVPAVSTALRPLDLQVAGIAAMASERKRIDCIIVGSSVAWTSLDPREIDAGLRSRGARPLGCYNFGLGSLTVEEAAALSRILVSDYHPRVLVYAFTVRDFRSVTLQENPTRILGLPWVRHREGAASFEGWLTAHSAAYRQMLPYGLLLRPTAWKAMRWHDGRRSIDGYVPSSVVAAEAALPVKVKSLFGRAADQAMPTTLGALGDLLDLGADGVQVMLLEVPVSRAALVAYAPTMQEYRPFVRDLRRRARTRHAWFARRSGAFVPEGGWSDPIHMNEAGARLWSRWVGERLAALHEHTHPPTEGS